KTRTDVKRHCDDSGTARGGCRGEFAAQSVRVVPTAALEPAAVLVRHQSLEPVAVVMCRDRCETACPDDRNAAALRLDPAARLRVVDGRDELFLARAHLKRERSLARFGQQLLRREAVADLPGQPEP